MSDSRERCEELLMRSVDGLLTEEEERELGELLDQHPEYRDELEDFARIKEATDSLRARILEDARIEPLRPDAASRLLLGIGFWLMLGASVFLMGFAAWAFVVDAQVPLSIRIAFGAGGIGLLALFLHVLRIRRRAIGRDPYREIDL